MKPELLTSFEKEHILQIEDMVKNNTDYYYDNPSAAIDDIQFLLKLINKDV